MDFITIFLGRFHPLLVHLPIGVLLLAFLFECMSANRRYKYLRKAIPPSLFWGSVFAAAAVISGYFLRQEGGYEHALADLHQNFGIATAVLCFCVYVLRRKMKFWIADPVKRKQARILLFAPLIALLSLTGHWGGSLTHGEDYLFAAVSLSPSESLDPVDHIRRISNVEEAVLYDAVIQPILAARCYDCHSAKKEKGDLRLDKVEYILRGGKNGAVIKDGPADSSALFHRLLLPLEDEEHMPPREKPQLSSSEVALIKYWLEGDADFEKPVVKFANNEKIASIVRSMQQAPVASWIPTQPVAGARAESLKKLQSLGITPLPLAEGSNHLMVTFTSFKEVTDEQITALQEIKTQLVWLDLSRTGIEDAQMQAISTLSNLRVLYLNSTKISDAGLEKIAPLSELRLLSLVGTRITDESIRTFEQLTNLTNLFLFQTSLTGAALENYGAAHEDLKLDTGNYKLEALPGDTVIYEKG